MNLANIINEISDKDPEFFERTSQRRDVIKNWSRKVALTALPFALGSMFKKAYGKNTDLITDTLNFALTLEYLEAEFYTMAIDKATFPDPEGKSAFTMIRDHENAHVAFLKAAITNAGGSPVGKPNFDFTSGKGSGNGPFADVFNDYNLLLIIAQTLEDTGVRAYKGQVTNLMSNNEVLTAALRIHSVEGRHASHIRSMRMFAGAGDTKPWIIGKRPTVPAVQASYDGEDNVTQAGINIAGFSGISNDAATQAFDEPLDKERILSIINPFLA